MVDLHSHILPQFDDGAKSEEETLKMGKIAMEEGISKIIATPHYIYGDFTPSKEELLEKVNWINNLFIKEEVDIEVLPGNEIYLTPEVPKLLQDGKVLSLNNGPYVLIEFPMADIPIYAEEILYEVRLLGYKPVIAHPERYGKIIENPNILKDLIEQGNYIQINSQSVTGRFGEKAQSAVEILLKHNMVHFIGTDAHSCGGRAPKIKKALEKIEKYIGTKAVEDIINNNLTLVKGEEIAITNPLEYRHNKRFLHKITGLFTSRKRKQILVGGTK